MCCTKVEAKNEFVGCNLGTGRSNWKWLLPCSENPVAHGDLNCGTTRLWASDNSAIVFQGADLPSCTQSCIHHSIHHPKLGAYMAASPTSAHLPVVNTSYRYEVSLGLFCSAPNLQWRPRVALCNYNSKETLGVMHSGSLLLAVHCACRLPIYDISCCNPPVLTMCSGSDSCQDLKPVFGYC